MGRTLTNTNRTLVRKFPKLPNVCSETNGTKRNQTFGFVKVCEPNVRVCQSSRVAHTHDTRTLSDRMDQHALEELLFSTETDTHADMVARNTASDSSTAFALINNINTDYDKTPVAELHP